MRLARGVPIALLCYTSWAAPPGVVIAHEPATSGRYIGSPSIAILPNGDYVASHDFFGPASTETTSGLTRVFRSIDKGRSWQYATEVKDQFWSNLFVHGGDLYLMGASCNNGRVVIRRSRDGGRTWTAASFLTTEPGYHTAPTPVIEWDGRLWRAMEYHPSDGPFQAFLLYARADSDLLAAKSWETTNRLPYPAKSKGPKSFREGNAVSGREGYVIDVLRVDGAERAAIAGHPRDKLEFEEFVDFPGGSKKFTIRFDQVSRKYWTLSNPILKEYSSKDEDPASVRNTLAMMSSKDLRRWRVERVVVTHPEPEKYGFQYADWQFDGADIVAVARTAFDDESGPASSAHNANYLTFHRVDDFRRER